MKHVVTNEWLLAHLSEANLIIADTRFALGQPEAGRLAYEEGHIPGAVYLDLEKDLSAPIEAHGGRHPLPAVDVLAERLGRAGITNNSRVVVYDDQGGAMASRLWWVLQYLGHDEVYVLERGFSAWKQAGNPVDAEPKASASGVFVPNPRKHWLVSMEEVRAKLGAAGTVLIDSREAPRYRGESESIDKAAGHIPGAINKFWKDLLDEQGQIKSAAEIAKNFADVPRDQEIIVYCGSGVTATPNVLGLSEAGFEQVRLYAGSWSDWISYAENPIARGEE
ncbi:thiosulfate sulfurtransferase [Paenibacillus marchantiophytorum]|uniref:Thiosulfate sulfurtransferase n=1 Tax=Paenibacillus marchantiophytorum TaxID=1619310 RepID=A0ABQ1F2C6_9BACL|nr:sulfurtransferase [Paenibacillus marchantiophytorum]GFZ97047.1 thiosulfate sulfurtransferase [Paenibacillus marchantiophytorum]